MSLSDYGDAPVASEADIVSARKISRELATQLGFGITDVTRVVTAVSELARNIYRYAGSGVMHWQNTHREGMIGLELTFIDQGPGIPDLDLAFRPGYTSGNGLGLGLSGTKRLMDDMEIDSEVGKGTRIVIRKWLRK
jgi:serine/threonine-protein kinase RsbT